MRPLYRKIILEPDGHEYDCTGAFNPACARDGDEIHVLYRASDTNRKSTLGYARLDLEHAILERTTGPVLVPSTRYDRFGVEDSKLIRWGQGWLLLYHAIGTDGGYVGVGTAGAYTRDFRRIKKLGIIRPFVPFDEVLPAASDMTRPKLLELATEYEDRPNVRTLWGKDLVLFPEKIDGECLAIYRLPPVIGMASLDSLPDSGSFWRSECLDQRHLLLSREHWFEARSISPSAPPILTKYGWILVFHCIHSDIHGNAYYTASAALLDANNPRLVLGRMSEPLLEPEQDWERCGTVNNCVYVTSVDVRDELLYIYYGAADVRSAVAAFSLSDVVSAMH